MSNIEVLAAQQVDTAELIARDETWFDNDSADLLLRNMYVLTERIGIDGFNALSLPTRQQVLAVAQMAGDIAPVGEGDKVKLPSESQDEYEYRTTVALPICSLERMVAINFLCLEQKETQSKIRMAVEGAGRAFGSVLLETQAKNEVEAAIRYFWGNVSAATRRVNRRATGMV
jgi:hypothetical protein